MARTVSEREKSERKGEKRKEGEKMEGRVGRQVRDKDNNTIYQRAVSLGTCRPS